MVPTPQLDNYSDRWERHWGTEGVDAGTKWDMARAAGSLVRALGDGTVDAEGLRTFVPGCGRGYDLVAFLDGGALTATGLEISPSAARTANAYLTEQLGEEATSGPEPRARVVVGDFFGDLAPHGGPFDIGYDYTFFCAMHPGNRERWAASWARAIKPGGKLVALVFPVDASMDPSEGPPFPVTPELARSLLEPAGFALESLALVPSEDSHPKRAGREYLGVWTRRASASI